MSSVVTLYGMKELVEQQPATFQVDWVNPKQYIGIEIEVERGPGVVLGPSTNDWSMKSDGSLRNGVEYVLSRPLRGDALTAAIEEFFNDNQPVRSPTSGTHIHVDMRGKESTLDVVRAMAAIIACIEPAIFGMFADGRDWCGYTNPLITMPAHASYPVFSDKATSDDFAMTFRPNDREYKYYGFNMMPLGRYGSVEFRYFNTAESAQELIEWVQFCMAVKEAAVGIGSPAGLKPYLQSESDWSEFIERFFSSWRDRMLNCMTYKDVYFRWKKTRTRAAVNRAKPAPRKKQATKNALATTKFKKFFAVKIKDEATGKSKLVYDYEELLAGMPIKVYHVDDPYFNEEGRAFRTGDVLLHNYMLYLYSSERMRWVEWAYLNNNHTSIIETYDTVDAQRASRIVTAIETRLAGNQTPNRPGALLDMSTDGRAWRNLNSARSAIISWYATEQDTAPAVDSSDEAQRNFIPEEYRNAAPTRRYR